MATGGGQPTQQNVTTTTSNLPEYARPYFEGLMQRSQSTLTQDYTPYGQERIAGFTPEQQQVQQNVLSQQTPGQFGAATGLGTAAGLGSLMASQYDPSQFGVRQVRAMGQGTPTMQGAQSGYQPELNYFQMGGPDSFTSAGNAQQYMSPYIQQALEPQRREAIRGAQMGQLAQDLGAARQGTYGGSRQLLAAMERERNLGQQLGDIEARGMQTAYEQAQGQFNAEQQARQAAQQANLQAALGVQGLGAQYGSQMALANLSNVQQAQVQNQAAQLQQQGLNQQQALQAALANQQQGLEAQRLSEQSRQFGADLGLRGLAQTGQMAQTLGNLGQMQSQTDLARLNQQQQTAAQQQALNQQYLDTAYQDFLRQRDYPIEQLQQYSSLLRGVPVEASSTKTTYAPQPGIAQQILGTGLGALGLAKTLGG